MKKGRRQGGNFGAGNLMKKKCIEEMRGKGLAVLISCVFCGYAS